MKILLNEDSGNIIVIHILLDIEENELNLIDQSLQRIRFICAVYIFEQILFVKVKVYQNIRQLKIFVYISFPIRFSFSFWALSLLALRHLLALSRLESDLEGAPPFDQVLGQLELSLEDELLYDLFVHVNVEEFLATVVNDVINYRILLSFNASYKGLLKKFFENFRGLRSIEFFEGHSWEFSEPEESLIQDWVILSVDPLKIFHDVLESSQIGIKGHLFVDG